MTRNVAPPWSSSRLLSKIRVHSEKFLLFLRRRGQAVPGLAQTVRSRGCRNHIACDRSTVELCTSGDLVAFRAEHRALLGVDQSVRSVTPVSGEMIPAY